MTKHSNVFQRRSCFTHIFTEITVKKIQANSSKVDPNSKQISKTVPIKRKLKYRQNFITGRTNDHSFERIVKHLIIKIDEETEIHVKDFITELPSTIYDNIKEGIMGRENFEKFKKDEFQKKGEKKIDEITINCSQNENK